MVNPDVTSEISFKLKNKRGFKNRKNVTTLNRTRQLVKLKNEIHDF